MNQMEIFKNPEFGAIRAVEIDGEPWLVGKDVSLRWGTPIRRKRFGTMWMQKIGR